MRAFTGCLPNWYEGCRIDRVLGHERYKRAQHKDAGGSVMELAAIVLPVIGIVVGVVVILLNRRKAEENPAPFSGIDGVLKQDWTRTGKIDFHIKEVDSASPQLLALRVEEQKITENAMGQDITQLRWRLATVDEAKEVVVHWNAAKADGNLERRSGLLRTA
jgi:hypothetical protein